MKVLSPDKTESILDASPARIAYVDDRCRLRYANRAYREWYGIRDGCVTGQHVAAVLGPQSFARVADQVREALAGRTVRFETTADHPVHGRRQADVSLIPDVGPGGDAAGFFVFAFDMSDLSRARQAESLLASALRHVTDGVSLYDAHDRMVFTNGRSRIGDMDGRMHPSARFDDIVRAFADRYLHDPAEREAYLQHRIQRRQHAPSAIEVQFDGRWVMFRDFLTGDGGVISIFTDISDLKKTQLALAESEQRYRTLVEVSPDIVVVHRNGRIIYANPAAVAFYAVDDVARLIGQDPLEFLHPDDRPIALARRKAHTAVGTLSGFLKMRFILADGSERTGEGCIGTILWEGEPAALAMIRDITERERMTRALRESEDRYRRLVELLPEGVVATEGGIITFANSVAAQIHGAASPEELIGRPMFDLIHPDFLAEARRRRVMLLEEGRTPPPTVHRHLRLDGGPDIYVEKRARAVEWNEKPVILGVMRDITEQRRIEAALRDNEEFLRAITDNVPVLISFVGRDGRFQFVNRRHEEWFGVDPASIVGRVCWDFVAEHAEGASSEDVREHVRSSTERALKGETVVLESVRLYSSGKRRHIRTTLVPHYAGEKTPNGVSVLIYDTTAQKAREEELRAGRDEAERANRSKSRFLAAASHDLRQPLQALNLFTFALLENARFEKDRTLIQDMRYALEAMESVLNGLIDISKLDAGVVTPQIVDFSLAELLERLRGAFSVQARQKNLDFRIVRSDATIRTDPDLFARILENLTSNAIKHTLAGRVVVGCRRRPGAVRVEIWDTGVGIPADQQAHIFEEFYQLGNSARERSKGLGLGLAIVDRAARLLGHPIELRSEPGRGSMFAVSVPLGAATDHAPREERAHQACSIRGNRVLVIDDDQAVLCATTNLLKRWGAGVASATCTGEAVAQVTTGGFRPDVVIADFSLPHNETGTKAIQSLREALGYPVSGVIITADTAPARVEEASAAGIQVLYKPVDVEALRTVIGGLIGRSAAP